MRETDNLGGSGRTVALSGTGVAAYAGVQLFPTALTFSSQQPVGEGSHSIAVTYSGDQYYTPLAAQTVPVTSVKANQTTSFGSLPNVTYGAAPITLAGTAGSGLPVAFTVVSGPATIASGVLTITGAGAAANNLSSVYGAALPTLTYTIAGFVDGDTAATATSGTAALATTALAASQAGSYPISTAAGTLTSTNYNFAFVPGALTIQKAVLLVAANNFTIVYGSALPAFTYSISGFVNGDRAAVLTGAPTETTKAVPGSAIGSYPIAIAEGTLAAANYSFTFVEGTLTMTLIGTAATPTFTPAAGSYSAAQTVRIADTTAGATIYHTTNGATPATASTKYTGAIAVSVTETLHAIAVANGYTQSAVATAAYTVN